MSGIRLPQAFNAAALTQAQHDRLESLLAALEEVGAARWQAIVRGEADALRHWLRFADAEGPAPVSIYSTLSPEKFENYIKLVEAKLSPVDPGQEAVKKLMALPQEGQRKAADFIAAHAAARFIDRDAQRACWNKIRKLHATILQEFPSILYTAADIRGAVRAGRILHKARPQLKQEWRCATDAQKIFAARDFWRRAYPQDGVEKLDIIVTPDQPHASASYQEMTDTVFLGTSAAARKSWATVAGTFAHEFQHRRQGLLIGRLLNNELKKGSGEYYTARLFAINLAGGGYLNASSTDALITNDVRIGDYYRQPVERHANDLAHLTCMIAGKGALSRRWQEWRHGALSDIVRPLDTALYYLGYALLGPDSKRSRHKLPSKLDILRFSRP